LERTFQINARVIVDAGGGKRERDDVTRSARASQPTLQLDDELVAQLDGLAAWLGTNGSELLRRGAHAVITAEDPADADRELVAAYRRQPADPALVQSARGLAARTVPAS
jgi:hypothetical protein